MVDFSVDEADYLFHDYMHSNRNAFETYKKLEGQPEKIKRKFYKLLDDSEMYGAFTEELIAELYKERN